MTGRWPHATQERGQIESARPALGGRVPPAPPLPLVKIEGTHQNVGGTATDEADPHA